MTTSQTHGAVPSKVEPEYAEALLAWHDQKYNDVIQLTVLIDKTLTGIPEIIELQALAYKALNKKDEAGQCYQRLIDEGKKSNRTARELAPYKFELGMLLMEQKKNEEAISLLLETVDAGVNLGPSHFFLGSLYESSGKKEKAENHYSKGLYSSIAEFEGLSALRLGLLFSSSGDTNLGMRMFYRALKTAEKLGDSGPKKTIQKTAESMLNAINQNSWSSSLSAMMGIDSNINSVPDSTFSKNYSGTRSNLIKGSASISRITSPVKPFQWVGSYRASIPWHENRTTKTSEFFAQNISNYFNFKPLAPLSWGFKLLIDATHQNIGPRYEPYQLTGTFGGITQLAIDPRRIFSLETEWKPSRTFGDKSVGPDYKKSGFSYAIRFALAEDYSSRYWNPKWTLGFSGNRCEGREYRTDKLNFSLDNTMKVIPKTSLSTTIDLSEENYPHKITDQRTDRTISFSGSTSTPLNTRWSFLTQSSFNRVVSGPTETSRLANSSTKWSILFGASYTLL